MSTLTAKRSLLSHSDPFSPVSDEFRSLRNLIAGTVEQSRCPAVAVISAKAGEGKTTVAVNLAITYARAGKKVLLIDGCLRRPSLHLVFSCSNNYGLSHILCHGASLREIATDPGIPGLSVLTSGPAVPSAYPGDPLESAAMNGLLAEARDVCDIVIFDSPALLDLADAATIARKCDGVLWVLNGKTAKRPKVLEAQKRLQRLNARIFGCVLNQAKPRRDRASRHRAPSAAP